MIHQLPLAQVNLHRAASWRALLVTASLAAPASFAQSVTETRPEVVPAAVTLARVEVVGTRARLPLIAGSADVLGGQALETSRVFTINEALRRVPGVHMRDEEGFGLRPNIGLRGLNPTRTTKVTLLEDGLPLAYAPYGDNASYYHPPVDRFVGIEVLKGSQSLLFGPQTIGGVINYLTPDAPQDFGGFVQLAGGNRSYFNGHFRVGGRGALFDFIRKQGDGARDNLEHETTDWNFKYTTAFSARQSLTLRANYYTEDSIVTYSGLTQAEFERLGAEYNPFKNDNFDIARLGLSATHRLAFAEGPEAPTLLTNVYFSDFDRDWWRQSSNSQDGQHGAGSLVYVIDGVSATFLQHRLAGRRVDPDTQFPNIQGRLRAYQSWGVEPRFTMGTAVGELQAGVKFHREEQDRLQVNGSAPTARTGTLAENNFRETQAYSGFVAHRFALGQFAVTPIVRYERMDFDRLNRLNGVAGSASVDEVLPGLGVTWSPNINYTVFASAHRGFAPPRVEDLIGGTGTVTDVGAEDSLNFELGLRGQPLEWLTFQTAYFRNDYDNLIAVGSIAGGSTPLSEGEALFQGFELSTQAQWRSGLSARLAYTRLATARQETPFFNVATRVAIAGSVAGNRQPYAPRDTLTAAVSYAIARFDVELEAQHVGKQFSDFANTVAPTADGQRGVIGASTVWNAAVNYRASDQIGLFLTVKNLADKTYITDRTRGIQVGQPRLVHAGMRYAF
jgi:Fe(3+) dicitrate transport protein